MRIPRVFKFLSLTLLAAALFSAAPLAADWHDFEHDPRGVSLGGRAAFFRAQDGDSWSTYGGAQLRFYLAKVAALEGSADYRQETFPGTRVDVFPVQASLLLYLIPGYKISPYILGGGGWYFTHVKGPNNFDETSNRFGPHAGAGLQVFLNKYWSIDGSYRYAWIEDVQSREESNLLNKSFSGRGHTITAALNFHF